MARQEITDTNPQKPLRLWPGVLIVVMQWLVSLGLPVFLPDAAPFAALSGLVGALAIAVWWLFFSRAPWVERLAAVALMVVALFVTRLFLHESIAKAGMGMVFFISATPILNLAFVAWAVASRHLAVRLRRVAMVATILLACGGWMFLRTAGVTGGGDWDFKWRWAGTPEEQLLAQAGDQPTALSSSAAAVRTGDDWPGFRGADRDSIVRGPRIATEWSGSPPVELWRQPIGPGWSSFAVRDGLAYTQEQRGDDELVSSFQVATGELVWRHRDAARFWEPQAGAGPRATPALSDGRVYTLGATGILNALDAADGTVLWSRNSASDTDAKVPIWGFSSSPLVVGDLVIVFAGKLVAYDRATGEPRWFGPARGGAYSSPHLVTLDGVPQILMVSGAGATSVAAADGSTLWQDEWGAGIVQPALTAEGDVLISAGGMAGGLGLRRISAAQGPGGWTTEERWTSNRLKPNFNDFVVHKGQAFGFDGSILASLDLETGERKWKGGRYGNGQLLLLPDQDLLLVLSEKGELALVGASPDRFTELARFPALEGKTWNHPVLVGDILLVRNAEEMAAFRLPLADS